LKRALDRGIQVFIFIDKSVYSEYQTYLVNKSNNSINYKFVDNIKVYEFIEGIYSLPRNNPVSTFEISADITSYLRSQWAGLFQRFLQEEKRISEMRVLEEMRSVSNTLNDLVKYLTEEKQSGNEAIKNILMLNHPAFRRFAELTSTPYRVCFTNREELSVWLLQRSFSQVPEEFWDGLEHEEWWSSKNHKLLKVARKIFDSDGKLQLMTEQEWSNSFVLIEDRSNDNNEQPAVLGRMPPPPPPRGNSPSRRVARPKKAENDDSPF